MQRRKFITLLGIPKHNRMIKRREGRRDTYVVEFRTANGELLAISIPRTEANVIKPFQARMPLWSGSVRHRSVQTKKKRRGYLPPRPGGKKYRERKSAPGGKRGEPRGGRHT